MSGGPGSGQREKVATDHAKLWLGHLGADAPSELQHLLDLMNAVKPEAEPRQPLNLTKVKTRDLPGIILAEATKLSAANELHVAANSVRGEIATGIHVVLREHAVEAHESSLQRFNSRAKLYAKSAKQLKDRGTIYAVDLLDNPGQAQAYKQCVQLAEKLDIELAFASTLGNFAGLSAEPTEYEITTICDPTPAQHAELVRLVAGSDKSTGSDHSKLGVLHLGVVRSGLDLELVSPAVARAREDAIAAENRRQNSLDGVAMTPEALRPVQVL